jgi:hypothetical protein
MALSGTPGGSPADVLIGHWHGQLGPSSLGIAASDLTLGIDGTFAFTSGVLLRTGYSRLGSFYAYSGRYAIAGDRITFREMIEHKLTLNDVRDGDLGGEEIWRRTRTEGALYIPPAREFSFAVKIRNGQQTVVFRPTDGDTAPRDPHLLSASGAEVDDELDFYGFEVLKKTGDTIHGVVIVNEDILTDQTWTADRVYKLCPPVDASSAGVPLHVRATLTIEPGTVIQAVNGVELGVDQGGRIIANGTRRRHITFALSGDSRDHPTSATRKWNGIRLDGSWHNRGGTWNGTQGLSLSYCDISGALVGVYADGGDVRIDHCTFTGNEIGLVLAHEEGDDSTPPSTASVQHCTYQGNRVPVVIESNVSFDGTNLFRGGIPNHYDGIFVLASKGIESPVTWSNTDVPYVICRSAYHLGPDANDPTYSPGDALARVDPRQGDVATRLCISDSPAGSLALADGVVLKFRVSTREDRCGDAYLCIHGERSDLSTALKNWERATFTLYHDDGVKGDTDRLSMALDGSRAYWSGIYHDAADGLPPRHLTGRNIKYAAHVE